jgi:histidine ammonia-lyase
VRGDGVLGARVQDPFGLRVFPQTQGSLSFARDALDRCVTDLIRASQENPAYDLEQRTVVHHGAFFQAALGFTTESTLLALAGTAPTTVSRIRLLNDPTYSGLRPFLAAGAEGSSGLMMVEYVAAAASAELRNASSPASLGSVTLSRGVEDDAPFSPQSVAQLERAVASYRIILGCELLAAARALRLRERVGGHEGTFAEAVVLVSGIWGADEDQDLRPLLDEATRTLDVLANIVPSGSAADMEADR